MDDLKLYLNIDDNQDLDSIYHININKSFDYKLLNNLSNIGSITIGDIEVDEALEEFINNLEYLTSITIKGLNDDINISNSNIKSITIIDSNIAIRFINNLSNLDEIHFNNLGNISLKDVSIIRNVKTLIINNCNVNNQEYLIELDNIELLDISTSGIEDITTLIASKSLKRLIIDDNIYQHNKEYIDEFKNKDIEVLSNDGGVY